MELARATARVKSVEIVDVTRPASNFDFVDQRFGRLITLRRIMSQIRAGGGTTVVIETLDEVDDLAEENEDFLRLVPTFRPGQCKRLTFFRLGKGESDHGQRTSLGYAVLKEDFRSGESKWHVYESVLTEVRYPHQYIHGRPTYTTRCEGSEIHHVGYLYAQQNGVTKSCAHVALRTVLGRFDQASGLTYRDITRLSGKDLRRGCALHTKQMEAVLRGAHVDYSLAAFTPSTAPPTLFYKHVYGSIESGFPAILSFKTAKQGHALPIFGHTFSEDNWAHHLRPYLKPKIEKDDRKSVNEKEDEKGKMHEYIASDSWMSMFVGHDDNWGSNFCIPKTFLESRISHVLATAPSPLQLSSVAAEQYGVDIVWRLYAQLKTHPALITSWSHRLREHMDEGRTVHRPLLVTASKYLSHLRKLVDWQNHGEGAAIDEIADWLNLSLGDGHCWMIEISVPELFSANRRKIGEILMRTDDLVEGDRFHEQMILVRLPGLYVHPRPATNYYERRLHPIISTLTGHVPLMGCEHP